MRSLLAKVPVHTLRYDYVADGPANDGVWTEVLSSAPASSCAVEIFDSSGVALQISLGAPGSEDSAVIPYTITPNGSSILLPLEVSRTKRISVKALGDNASVGQLILNFFG